jgi:hypothetical protein
MIPSLPTSVLNNSIYSHWYVGKTNGCTICGCDDALKVKHPLKPDFVVPKELADRLQQSETAFCFQCGHLYRADGYTKKEIDFVFELLGNKDDTTSGEFMLRGHAGTIGSKIETYSQKEYLKWKKRLSKLTFTDSSIGKKILVLRPASIGCLQALEEVFCGADISWKDYSRSAESQIRNYKKFPELSHGFVRSYFEISSSNTKFDLVVINHCLQHSVSLNEDIIKVKNIIAKNGSLLLVNEVNRKLHNPFHINHFSEAGLRSFLARHFERITLVKNGIGLDDYKKGLFEGSVNKDFLTGSAIIHGD